MKVWLVRDLEPLPTDPGGRRLMRMGLLAQTLARQGIETRWITSSFDHYQKRQRFVRDTELCPEPNLAITVLAGPGYSRNVSLKRIAHNRHFARAFRGFAQGAAERPDVIVTDIPTTEAAAEAVAFARAHAIPAVVSIRDLWPDFFPSVLPAPVRPLARLLLTPMTRQAQDACAGADSLVGISRAYLDWGLDKAGRAQRETDAIIPLGYRREPLPPPEEQRHILSRLGVRPDARLVAFVGSWGQTYDLDLVERTAALFAGRPDVQFLIAGSGDKSPQLHQRFARHDCVLVPGWISAAEIAVVLARADIGLLPYTRSAPQGLPNKAFEYLAYGAYQISTIGGELDWFYDQTQGGTTLAAPTPQSLARTIDAVLADDGVLTARPDRISAFDKHWSAEMVYRDFIALIARLASARQQARS